jgi:hypothetical protein
MLNVYFYIGRLSYLIAYFDPLSTAPYVAPQTPVLETMDYFLGAPYVMQSQPATYFTIAYDLPISFLNNSIGISSPNSSICLGNISSLNTSFILLETQFNLQLYDKMGGSLQKMVQAIDPIARACYFSGFEYYQIVISYVSTIMNVDMLLYNVFHNAGTIYDMATDLISNFRFGDPTTRVYWQKIGGDIGLIVNQVSYKPTNYLPYVPVSNSTTPHS